MPKFHNFSDCLHLFALAKYATCSIRVKVSSTVFRDNGDSKNSINPFKPLVTKHLLKYVEIKKIVQCFWIGLSQSSDNVLFEKISYQRNDT